MYELTKEEKKTLKKISETYYMQPAINMTDEIILSNKNWVYDKLTNLGL